MAPALITTVISSFLPRALPAVPAPLSNLPLLPIRAAYHPTITSKSVVILAALGIFICGLAAMTLVMRIPLPRLPKRKAKSSTMPALLLRRAVETRRRLDHKSPMILPRDMIRQMCAVPTPQALPALPPAARTRNLRRVPPPLPDVTTPNSPGYNTPPVTPCKSDEGGERVWPDPATREYCSPCYSWDFRCIGERGFSMSSLDFIALYSGRETTASPTRSQAALLTLVMDSEAPLSLPTRPAEVCVRGNAFMKTLQDLPTVADPFGSFSDTHSDATDYSPEAVDSQVTSVTTSSTTCSSITPSSSTASITQAGITSAVLPLSPDLTNGPRSWWDELADILSADEPGTPTLEDAVHSSRIPSLLMVWIEAGPGAGTVPNHRAHPIAPQKSCLRPGTPRKGGRGWRRPSALAGIHSKMIMVAKRESRVGARVTRARFSTDFAAVRDAPAVTTLLSASNVAPKYVDSELSEQKVPTRKRFGIITNLV